ncbi:MAG TPA: PSD1 and planctomycete cytochrome C domain-containing protein [Gemmataceae bacterium]|nr:PSD1 and planctomycete cytochrome C domain-containing protein [Gemmataceae bacterium]
MDRRFAGTIAIPVTVLLFLGSVGPRTLADATPEGIEFFEKKIRPVLAEHCYSCHSHQAKKPRGGLLLDSRDALLKGGESGPAIVPGRPEQSRLIEAVGYKNPDLQMPPKARLSETAIADLATWIKMGAPWPKEVVGKGSIKYTFDLQKRKAEHWAWQPLRPQQPPAVKNERWPSGPVDRFLLAKLEAKGLSPAPPTDRRTLARRLYFDLIGLPPSPAEVEAFVNDRSPRAVERLVDHLLASPHFGERWGRHWLDLVRYGESRGHEFDYTNPNAYQYRDYVIRALNADVPYPQFVLEHVAGDLLTKPRLHPTEGFNESILGTGFWFLGEQVHSPVDTCQDKADRFDNMLDVMSKTFLGLTVACARCHDHKFDAISTKDYYALSGFLESSSYRLVLFEALEHNRRIAGELTALRDRGRPAVQKALAAALRPELSRVAEYLLAARAVQTSGAVEEVARQRKLDPTLLGRWVAHLGTAAKDVNDPLHAWTKAIPDIANLKALIESWRKREIDAAASNGAEVIVDYTKPAEGTWQQDGFTFGPAPLRPGDLLLGGDAARPLVRVVDSAAAERDPLWDRLKLAPGTEKDPGALGGIPRPGRTLRTPSFQVNAGKVFYLVRGAGRVFACVDGHVMISGPLHGQVVRAVKAGNGFQWVEHNLSRYKGRRVHLEFTPEAGADFAVGLVVQGERAPASLDRPNAVLLRMLSGKGAVSHETLAVAYQRMLEDTAAHFGADRIRDSEDATHYAQLANWLVQRRALFGLPEQIAEAAPFLTEQAKLAARIRTESRLALAMLDGSGVDEHVYIRGSYKTPGETAPRRFLEALAGPERLAVARGSGRLELARQMTDPALNPFLPRVMVNRVWHHLFGRGLVASVDNFGVLGEAPTHPELLDHLATEFVKDGWSIKKLIRTLVLSSAYQMSSAQEAKVEQADPQNLLLHRMNLRRLEGEAIRDAMLAVSGRLDRQAFGPSVPVYLTPFQDGRGRPASGPLDGNGRRSIYLAVRRNFLPSLLLAFDTPIPFSTVGRRTVSNVPAQALILLNDPFVHQQAAVWAKRVLAEKGSPQERIQTMYQSAFGRPATTAEVDACLTFLREQERLGAVGPAVWADLAHVLFNAKEFIYLQ